MPARPVQDQKPWRGVVQERLQIKRRSKATIPTPGWQGNRPGSVIQFVGSGLWNDPIASRTAGWPRRRYHASRRGIPSNDPRKWADGARRSILSAPPRTWAIAGMQLPRSDRANKDLTAVAPHVRTTNVPESNRQVVGGFRCPGDHQRNSPKMARNLPSWDTAVASAKRSAIRRRVNTDANSHSASWNQLLGLSRNRS